VLKILDSAAKATASEFEELVERTTYLLGQERRRKVITGGRVCGDLVEIQHLDNLAIVGDLHGDSGSLDEILSELDYERFLENSANKLVFLGDYVDRGDDSVGVLYSVCHLKQTYPESVVLMRGNHEAPVEFPFSPHDLPYEVIKRYGESSGRELYKHLVSMFQGLTVATIVEHQLLVIHGGLPTELEPNKGYNESLARAQENHISSSTLAELLWNDPRQINHASGWEPSERGIGRYFGTAVTIRWLQATGTRIVVRGHEPCQGFRIDHDGMVITIFSSVEPYPGCKAACLIASREELASARNASDLIPCVKFLR
jgi:protein phosphatase